MRTTFTDVRFRAIHVLQGLLTRHLPGSSRYDEIEHAIDLALSNDRALDQFLIRNVLRDAERIRRRAIAAHSYESIDAIGDMHAELADAYHDLVDYTDPAELVSALEEFRAVVQSLGHGEIAQQVCTGVISGKTATEISVETGFSMSYVTKTRMALMRAARARFQSER